VKNSDLREKLLMKCDLTGYASSLERPSAIQKENRRAEDANGEQLLERR
jgi:hypothetical protein